MTDRDLLLEFVEWFLEPSDDHGETPYPEDVDAFLVQRSQTSNQIEGSCASLPISVSTTEKEAGKSEICPHCGAEAIESKPPLPVV